MYRDLLCLPYTSCIISEKDEARLAQPLPCASDLLHSQEVRKTDYISVLLWHLFPIMKEAYSDIQALTRTFYLVELLPSYCQIQSIKFYHICGRVSFIQSKGPTKYQWIFDGIANYNTELHYHDFHIIFSKFCILNSLQITKSFRNCTKQIFYCGHLPPWNETCSCTSVSLQFIQTFKYMHENLDISYHISKLVKNTMRINIHITGKDTTIPLQLEYRKSTRHHRTIFVYAEAKKLIQLVSAVNTSNWNQGTVKLEDFSIVICLTSDYMCNSVE